MVVRRRDRQKSLTNPLTTWYIRACRNNISPMFAEQVVVQPILNCEFLATSGYDINFKVKFTLTMFSNIYILRFKKSFMKKRLTTKILLFFLLSLQHLRCRVTLTTWHLYVMRACFRLTVNSDVMVTWRCLCFVNARTAPVQRRENSVLPIHFYLCRPAA